MYASSKDFARDLKKMTWRAMELPNLNAEGKSDVGAHAYRKLDVTGIALEQIKVSRVTHIRYFCFTIIATTGTATFQQLNAKIRVYF